MMAVMTTPAGMPLSTSGRLVQLPAFAMPLFVPKRYKVMYGGRGAGRSWSVARALLILASQRTLRILCTRELQTSLKDSVMQLLKDQVLALGLEGFTFLTSELRHENGSLFLFEGLRHNVQRIKSIEAIDICWVEEAERITKESWDVLVPTIRKAGSEIWVTFNPDQEDDATYVRLIKHKRKDAWVCFVNSESNPWLTNELREEREWAYAVDPESAEHVWGGQLRKISDAQILRGKWFIEEFTPDENLWSGPYQGMDFGFADDPFAWCRLWVYQRVLYVEHEVFKVHLDIDFITDELQGSEAEGIPSFVTRADSSRPDSISYLRRHGLPRIMNAVKGPNSIEEGIAHLRSYRRIVVHPRCKHFADECKRYSYKVDERSGDVLPIVVDAHNHLIDCARYALEPLMKKRNQKPAPLPGSTIVRGRG